MHLVGVHPIVSLVVCLSQHEPTAANPQARPAGDTDRLLHGAQQRGAGANAGSATLSAYV